MTLGFELGEETKNSPPLVRSGDAGGYTVIPAEPGQVVLHVVEHDAAPLLRRATVLTFDTTAACTGY